MIAGIAASGELPARPIRNKSTARRVGWTGCCSMPGAALPPICCRHSSAGGSPASCGSGGSGDARRRADGSATARSRRRDARADCSAGQRRTRSAQAFALAREAARRHRGMRHFRVQLLGGAVMMSGALAEMQTGEGKTLTALLPAITAALMRAARAHHHRQRLSRRRDAEEFGPVYDALGLSVGLSSRASSRGTGSRPTPATSPTARTRSWCSTICATAWRSATAAPARASCSTSLSRPAASAVPAPAAARPAFRDRRRGRQRADRRGAHAAHPVRACRREPKRSRAVHRGARNRAAPDRGRRLSYSGRREDRSG